MIRAGAVMMDTNGSGRRRPCGTALPETSDGPVYGSLGKCSHGGPIPLDEFFLSTLLTHHCLESSAPRLSKEGGE